jgi:hypothetical protein
VIFGVKRLAGPDFRGFGFGTCCRGVREMTGAFF